MAYSAYSFQKSQCPGDLAIFSPGEFNLGVSLETLEHIKPELLDAYLQELARIVHGYLLFSVPNEKGFIFLLKYLLKFLTRSRGGETYSLSDIVNLTLGYTSRVKRNDHKGFDFEVFKGQVEKYFDLVKMEAGPISFLPPRFNMTVTFVVKTRSYN